MKPTKSKLQVSMWKALFQSFIYTHVILYYDIFKRQAYNIVGDKNCLCEIFFWMDKVKVKWDKKVK